MKCFRSSFDQNCGHSFPGSATIAQNRVDIAEQLGIAGLAMQEGFISGLFEAPDYSQVDAFYLESHQLDLIGKGMDEGDWKSGF